MSAQEESQLWFSESHNHAKKSKWLRSTLSELEEKTIKMLNLIQGNADTFAKRAEMYYRKRPELVDMIEDFYRSYRSLAENYDHIRSSRKYWNFIEKSSCDSNSEVDDPNEEEAVRKLEDLQEENNSEKCNTSVYSFETGQVEEKNLTEKKDMCEMKPIIDRIRSTKYTIIEDNVEIASKIRSMEEKRTVYQDEEDEEEEEEEVEEEAKEEVEEEVEEEEEEVEEEAKEEVEEEVEEEEETHNKNESKEFTVSSDNELRNESGIVEKTTQVEFPENLSDVRVEKPMNDITKQEKENFVPSLIDNEENEMISEVERLKGENASYKMDMEGKDEEKREVIRQLSTSLDILRRENDSLRNFIRCSRNRGRVFEIGGLKVAVQKNPVQKPVKTSFPLVAL